MKLNSILKSIGLLFISLANAQSDECENLKNSLGTLNYSTFNCYTNSEGEIYKLEINNQDLTEEQVNKLLSYDLTELSYTIYCGRVNGTSPPRHSGYSDVPSDIQNLKHLENLKIFYSSQIRTCTTNCIFNVLSDIDKGVLKDLKSLKSLEIEGFNISQDNIDDISTLENLEFLNLEYSYMKSNLNYTSFSNLKNLSVLHILNSSNSYRYKGSTVINSISDNLINNVPSLKELTITMPGNNVNIRKLSNLEKLDVTMKGDDNIYIINKMDKLVDLKLGYVPNGQYDKTQYRISNNLNLCGKLDNLKSLHLSRYSPSKNNMIDIACLPNLTDLTLSSCDIIGPYLSELNESASLTSLNINVLTLNAQHMNGLSSLSNIKKLGMKTCTLSEDQLDVLSSLKNLESLYMESCKLTKIPEFLFSLPNIKSIDLSGNSIRSLDERLVSLENLETLILKNNIIRGDIPESLNNLTQLKEVDFSYNYLEGKTLTNPNLEKCNYTRNSVCLAKVMACSDDQNITLCSDMETEVKPTMTTEVAKSATITKTVVVVVT